MATATQSAAARTKTQLRIPPLDYWHLLSLDAPTVAALWTWFLPASNHIHLPPTAILAMAIAVWTLYAADRLLDARKDTRTNQHHDLEPRHLFHRRHSRAFRLGIVIAAVALAILLPDLAPPSIRLYLILGSLLLAYFAAIHTGTRRLPKELAVGIFFSAATFISTVAQQPALRPQLLPPAILFALLCSLNCLFIYAWEHPHPTPPIEPHPATTIALRLLRPLALVTAIAATSLTVAGKSPWPIPAAIAIAAALLLLLDNARHRLTPTTLRAAADLCLLTPLLFIAVLQYP
jgi:hypothetical protein